MNLISLSLWMKYLCKLQLFTLYSSRTLFKIWMFNLCMVGTWLVAFPLFLFSISIFFSEKSENFYASTFLNITISSNFIWIKRQLKRLKNHLNSKFKNKFNREKHLKRLFKCKDKFFYKRPQLCLNLKKVQHLQKYKTKLRIKLIQKKLL